ncbi:DUF2865 domain-containing protein [Hyphomicrobium sp.]|uniref:DUF2865 domain-containing protein n=1 Tax=Hyphomicrobium sp. TaxID=82 RepID=UPI003F6F8981
MLLRLSILVAIGFASFALWGRDDATPPAGSAVLGSGMSISDVISGTYDRPEEGGRRKAKVQLAVQKTAKRKPRCGENGTTCASRRPKMRDLNGGYRTLCVRLCDGYYFPISAAAQPAEFARDEETCQAACGSPAMLFVYKNGEGAPETMTSLDGKPYASLATAFKHRVSYDAACTCTASPWTEASAERHRLYAAEQAALSGDPESALQVAALTSAVQETRKRTRARTGADLVASRSAEVIAGASRQRMEAANVRKAAVAREPTVRAKVRATERVKVRPVRQAEARMVRALRAGETNRAIERRIRVSDARMVVRR